LIFDRKFSIIVLQLKNAKEISVKDLMGRNSQQIETNINWNEYTAFLCGQRLLLCGRAAVIFLSWSLPISFSRRLSFPVHSSEKIWRVVDHSGL
jgi:hypothetical protein